MSLDTEPRRWLMDVHDTTVEIERVRADWQGVEELSLDEVRGQHWPMGYE